jgi:hypothetical protein
MLVDGLTPRESRAGRSGLGSTSGTPPSTMATHEFVVPRSMPMTRSMVVGGAR